MINLEKPTDLVVRNVLAQLIRQVPWYPARQSLLDDARKLEESAASMAVSLNELFMDKIFCSAAPDASNDTLIAEVRQKERELREEIEDTTWRYELMRLSAAAWFTNEDEYVVDHFAASIVEDIRHFQAEGYSEATSAMRAVSRAVKDALAETGFDLGDLMLPPTVDELVEAGADRPAHIDEDLWAEAVEAFNHRMTIENTPPDFIGGGSDHDPWWDGDNPDDNTALSMPGLR